MRERKIVLALALSISSTAFSVENWQVDAVYNAGDIVSHHGDTYISTHWNTGNVPERSENAWDGWIYVDSESIPLYQHERAYNGSTVVNFEGEYYLSKWWVQGEYPDSSVGWRYLTDFSIEPDTLVEPPKPNLDPKSKEAIYGVDNDGDGIRDSYKKAVLEQYSNPAVIQLALRAGVEYKFLHELVLEDSIELSAQEAIDKMNSIVALEECINELRIRGEIQYTPARLYSETFYHSLYYRIGKRYLFKAMGLDFDAFILPEDPCPESLKVEVE